MKALLILLFLLITCGALNAQSWQCVQPGKKVYFTNYVHYLRGMRIDSVRTAGTGTICYPFHSLRGKWSPFQAVPTTVALDSMGGSWLGSKIIRRADGTTLFDNIWNDTIVIRTMAGVGDSWVFYSDTTRRYYEATVASADTMTVDGSRDSVKRINIQAKIAGAAVADSLNSFYILLSKNNGFAQVFDLVAFPYHEPMTQAYSFGLGEPFDYYLAATGWNGLATRPLHKYVFKRVRYAIADSATVYNYNPGDKFQWSTQTGTISQPGMDSTISTDSITAKSTAGGITTYNILTRAITVNYSNFPSVNYTYQMYNITRAYRANAAFQFLDTNKMPEEWYNPNIYFYDEHDTAFCITSRAYTIYNTGVLQPDAHVVNFEPCEKMSTVKEGIGEVVYSEQCLNGTGLFITKKLAYLKKGSVICGDLHSLSAGSTLKASKQAIIYPVPAANELTINNAPEDFKQIRIYNVAGRLVLEQSASGRSVSIPVSGLANGTYLLEVLYPGRGERKVFTVLH